MNTSKGVLIGLVAGVVIGAIFGSTSSYQSGYAAAQKEIRARLQQVGIIPPAQTEIRSISGMVKAINGSVLTVEVPAQFDPTVSVQKPSLYSVTIAPDTKVITREMDYKAVPKPNQPFNPIIEKTVTVKEILVGGQVAVEAGDLIKNNSFTAKAVIINK